MCDNTTCPLKDFGKKCEQYEIDHKDDIEKLRSDLIASWWRAANIPPIDYSVEDTHLQQP